MGVTLLYGCGQVEMSVRDLGAARAFMKGMLGAGEIEQRLAKEITDLFPNGELTVEHFDCGQAVFQFNEPSPKADYMGQTSIHQAYLDRIGSCVTNLNYYVDDARHAQELMAEMGAKTYLQGPSTAVPCFTDYGPENTREPDETRQFYFVGSRDLIGLDLEFMEPEFKQLTRQTVQYPCFVQPRPATGDGNLQLLRLRLVVRDLEEIYGNLVKIIAPASRSKAYDYREGALAKAFKIGVGGIELEYCQPLSQKGGLAEQLDRYGPGMVAAEFTARDLDLVLGRSKEAGAPACVEQSDLLGVKAVPGRDRRRHQIESRDLIGFDVVLERLDERPFAGNT